MTNDKINLQPLKDEGLSEQDGNVVSLFEAAFESLREGTVDGEARRVALQLQKLIPPDLPAERKEYLLWNAWEVLIGITKHVPHRNIRQVLVFKVLQILDSVQAWKGPTSERTMRDNWIDPTFEVIDGKDETYTLKEWLNFRHGLEEDLSPGKFTDCRVAVASESLIQAGPLLLESSLLERDDLEDGLKKSYRAGSLYTGDPGLSLERWGFWKWRLNELRGIVGKEVSASVDEAIGSVNAAATALAN
ncbi:hypothetical protein B0J13DRAFT_675694 [Dactylonectria estremocensis]|uniref:Uncharacterized protein n=1 Tax=Dactylonectria estremocensis TaxID=1079267 RepID=A0A9P9ETU4_9HYPO|nr:hypothetical protein B0J13DRAFT_675694 [Dactylonectria estremocensis]